VSKYKDKHPHETVAERKARVQAERIALAKQRSKNPGRSWRVLAQDLVDGRPISMQDRGEFDEVGACCGWLRSQT
jgi:hypothetical protein